ncbi:MAG: phosphotransferase [Sarcina sp.]
MSELKEISIEQVKEILKDNYKIEEIQNVKKIQEGASSECFYIKAKEKEYIFKDIEMIFMNHPESEGEINEVLLRQGIPVSKFYKTVNGEYLVNYLGHTCHLQSFEKGEILKPNTAPKWFLKESAQMLGKIHKALEEIPALAQGIGKDFFRFINPESARESYNKSLKLAIEYNDLQNQEDLKYRIKLLDKIKDMKPDISKFTCKNTHGDYFISQILCDANSINAVIDFTSACVHPVSWEIIRSYSYADPKCINGELNIENLKVYIKNYLEYSELNEYDIRMMGYLYFYQLAVCDYFSQYYESNNTNRKVLLHYAHWSTLLCKWLDENIENLTQRLVAEFF